MIRRIPTCLLLIALVTSGPALRAQAGGKTTPPAGGKAAAPAAKSSTGAPVTAADMKEMLGAWTIPLETPNGRLVATLVFRVDAGGKVVAGISAPQLPEQKITDITKNGQVLTLKASMDYQGPLTAYSGPVAMVMTLRPKGPDQAAWFEFNNGGYQIGGMAKKKS
jgi:hypothetical protein